MRAQAVLPAGTWDAGEEVDQVVIDFDRRYRRRLLMRTERGAEVLLDLPHAMRLRDGDGLALQQGGVLRVRAAPEALLEFHAPDAGAMARIAWHLGNRHLPVQMLGDRMRIRDDHVIRKMVEGLGGQVAEIAAPFDPEPGAYAGGHHHHHEDE